MNCTHDLIGITDFANFKQLALSKIKIKAFTTYSGSWTPDLQHVKGVKAGNGAVNSANLGKTRLYSICIQYSRMIFNLDKSNKTKIWASWYFHCCGVYSAVIIIRVVKNFQDYTEVNNNMPEMMMENTRKSGCNWRICHETLQCGGVAVLTV